MDRRSSGCAGPFFLGEADCPVAPLLAMTRGGGPCTRRHLPVFCMSLRTSAHTGAAIRSPRRETWQVGTTFGKSVALFRIRPKYYLLLCPAAGNADCHVASLLAMTCRNMRLSAVATAWCQANLSRFRIRPRRYFLLCPAAGVTDCHVASLLAMTSIDLAGLR